MPESKLGKRYDLYGQPAPVLGRGRVPIVAPPIPSTPADASGASSPPSPSAGTPSDAARDAGPDVAALQQVAHGQLTDALHQLFQGQIPPEYLTALKENPDWDAEDFARMFGSHLLQNYMIHPQQLFDVIGAGP